jgi:hypothetical protein
MNRKKSSSADNQQERSKQYLAGYVVGLVDGEGSFHVAFPRRDDLTFGMAVIPEFHLSQHKESKQVLELTKKLFGCGYIKENHRNSADKTLVYVIRSKEDLLLRIIPFFEIYQLKTSKKKDFEIFARIVKLIHQGKHSEKKGLRKIINLAYSMNQSGKRRIRKKEDLFFALKSSETIRRTPPLAGKT